MKYPNETERPMRRHARALICAVSAVLCVPLLWAASGGTSAAATATTLRASRAPSLKIAVDAPFADEYFTTWLNGAKAAAKKLHVVILSSEANSDQSQQTSLIQAAVSAGANAAIFAVVDVQGAIPLLDQLGAKGIPVVTTDGPAGVGPRLAHFASSDMALGEEEGNALMAGLAQAKIAKPWRIVTFAGLPGTYSGMTRVEGAVDAMEPLIQKHQIILVANEIANFDRSTAFQQMQALLTTTRDIDGVMGANDDMTIGAMEAAKDAGLVPGKTTIFVGTDVIADAVAAIKDGQEYASVSQAPYLEAYYGVATIYFNKLTGCKPLSISNTTPTVLVKKANVNTFLKQVQFNEPGAVQALHAGILAEPLSIRTE